jgi:hypothetical protein
MSVSFSRWVAVLDRPPTAWFAAAGGIVMRAVVNVALFAALNPVSQIAAMWLWLPTFWWGDALAGFVPFWAPIRFVVYWATGL